MTTLTLTAFPWQKIPLATCKMPLSSWALQTKPVHLYLPSETVDPQQIEAQAITTSKWDTLDPPEPPKFYDSNISSDEEDESNSRDYSKEKRSKLHEMEVKTMQYQDELEAGQRELKHGWTMTQQVEHYRKKLIKKKNILKILWPLIRRSVICTQRSSIAAKARSKVRKNPGAANVRHHLLRKSMAAAVRVPVQLAAVVANVRLLPVAAVVTKISPPPHIQVAALSQTKAIVHAACQIHLSVIRSVRRMYPNHQSTIFHCCQHLSHADHHRQGISQVVQSVHQNLHHIKRNVPMNAMLTAVDHHRVIAATNTNISTSIDVINNSHFV